METPLALYNSLTRQKEVFRPLFPPFVGMYLCGPTVYGKAHLGHARSSITFDIVFRYLLHLKYTVRYVRNITDVGHLERDADEGADKIQQQARLEAASPMEIAQRYTNSYRKNMEQLNVLLPSIEPCASGHIPEQIAQIEAIMKAGMAYVVDGSVYFDVEKYNKVHTYGTLSGTVVEAMRSGTRCLTGQAGKRTAADFALWKKATPTHIMRWPSPWGVGFPGWHIECSVLATHYLGPQFDIHGGGMDLLFPHHECEMAQSQVALNTHMATYWMHNNLVTIQGVKMGKSLGNFITLDALFAGDHTALDQSYSPMALRFFMLQAHYRSTLSVSLEALAAAQQGYRKLMNGVYACTALRYPETAEAHTNYPLDAEIQAECANCRAAINDDFNTAKALATLFNLLKKINGLYYGQLDYALLSQDACRTLCTTYRTFVVDILGFKEDHPTSARESIDLVLEVYRQAKAEKRYEQVDFIRSGLQKIGIGIQDHPQGSRWEYQ